MSGGRHGTSLERLPATLPVFPLSGVLLLPGGRLPLNIFEPRYLEMVEHALASERLIGMVQPLAPEDEVERPRLYATGCAGRIGTFAETDDGRYLITLVGVCRFRILDELPVASPYRRARVSFAPFRADLGEAGGGGVDRERLLAALKAYLGQGHVDVDWNAIQDLDDEALVTSLAMACPFQPSEKQALLEAADLGERARALISLIEMEALMPAGAAEAPRQ